MSPYDISARSPLFRGAVIVGAIALVIGVIGIFYFDAREGTLRADRPRDACAVLVNGLGTTEGLVLRATWTEPSGDLSTDQGRPGNSDRTWIFVQAPEATPLTLRIERHVEGAVALVHEQPAVFTRGAVFEVWLPRNR